MSFLRPEAAETLHRWREPLAGAGAALLGLWVISFGGPFFAMLGGGAVAVGAGLAVIGWRRLRFARGGNGPGMVEVDEGQVAYFGPLHGGYVALADMSELVLMSRHGERAWRLRQSDGTVLFVPVAATGSEALFDAFAALPGIDMQALLAALDAPPGAAHIVWRRHRPRLLH
ncbi:hypothetical protein [Acidimangrovimonas pyrenivorans]|uniref:Uncharacterized protein n=1 Tax=Acidimangrovimonas pyrenivorans TaxID=2030798 RepID=A0ABV7ALU0_9RHOB